MSEEETPAPAPPFGSNVSQQDAEAAFALPAVFANKVVLTMTPTSGRLSFLETSTMGVQGRAAIILLAGDLIALRDLLNRSIPDSNISKLPLGAQDDASGS